MPDFIVNTRKKKEYEQFTCRIEADLMDNIRRIVKENNFTSINEFINDCLRFSINNISNIKD